MTKHNPQSINDVRFHTHHGTSIRIIRKDALKMLWVEAHPDDKNKSFLTHIDYGAIRETSEEIEKYLEELNKERT
jgi:hypothetical protein